ncbi:hypothetical protein D9Q81_06355 [Candidatus Korarchaeum cryptofilum]|jgi:hypothetical protein|uniref:Uncharacterized protein n=1 Tax=Candidatus Korarchaeum cryptofilum TaxID=498846 RepID=A0A429G3A3_9CREN|nr:hypothetical protein [Candidatus Korarchaeum cryptofilum]RSN68331.1 hypothetical protein D9Q81_06355 [Candidatus Korarchaeum cryptofilum]
MRSSLEILRYIRSHLERLEDHLNRESIRIGDIRSKLGELYVDMKELERGHISPRNIYERFLESLEEIHGKLEEYKPEEILKEGDRREIEKATYRWRFYLSALEASERPEEALSLLEGVRRHAQTESEEIILRDLMKISKFISYIYEIGKGKEECTEYIEKLSTSFWKFLEEAEESFLEQRFTRRMRDRLGSSVSEWISWINVLIRRGCTELRRHFYLKMGVEGDSLSLSLEPSQHSHFILGRFDPGGIDPDTGDPPDRLAIRDSSGRVLKVFKTVKCNYPCGAGEEDCTHRRHLELVWDPDRQCIIIKMCERAHHPVFYNFAGGARGQLTSTGIELKLGQCVSLWLSGVYNVKGERKVPVELCLRGE